ncbi:hypothetical protein OsJ_01639 [Oryza sativa Japonica Group]|nr:hypothetical protein OsJ_01639 [Oryza sativa Japonica Group]
MSYGCQVSDDEPNGSKAVSLLLRLSTLALALTSAVVMATASECTVVQLNGVVATITYKDFPPFVYLVGFNIAAAMLEAAAIYLRLSTGGGDDDDEGFKGKLPGILLVVIDVAVQALVYTATGGAFAAVSAVRPADQRLRPRRRPLLRPVCALLMDMVNGVTTSDVISLEMGDIDGPRVIMG